MKFALRLISCVLCVLMAQNSLAAETPTTWYFSVATIQLIVRMGKARAGVVFHYKGPTEIYRTFNNSPWPEDPFFSGQIEQVLVPKDATTEIVNGPTPEEVDIRQTGRQSGLISFVTTENIYVAESFGDFKSVPRLSSSPVDQVSFATGELYARVISFQTRDGKGATYIVVDGRESEKLLANNEFISDPTELKKIGSYSNYARLLKQYQAEQEETRLKGKSESAREASDVVVEKTQPLELEAPARVNEAPDLMSEAPTPVSAAPALMSEAPTPVSAAPALMSETPAFIASNKRYGVARKSDGVVAVYKKYTFEFVREISLGAPIVSVWFVKNGPLVVETESERFIYSAGDTIVYRFAQHKPSVVSHAKPVVPLSCNSLFSLAR